jgi:hypothetical protein
MEIIDAEELSLLLQLDVILTGPILVVDLDAALLLLDLADLEEP